MTKLEARLAAKRKMTAATRIAGQSKSRSPHLPVAWFLTDPARTPDPISIMEKLPTGWGVVYRHFGASNRLEVAANMKLVAKQRGLTLSASFDPLIMKLGLDGVHWPRWALQHYKRSTFKTGFNTSSAHSFRQITQAAARGMNACFVSAIFKSQSPSAPIAMGMQRYRQLCQLSPISLIALGGITHAHAGRIAHHGSFASVDGVVQLFD